jgi:hypothetical protein
MALYGYSPESKRLDPAKKEPLMTEHSVMRGSVIFTSAKKDEQ